MQMSKRLTETEKWKDAWFSDLDNDMKLAWLYILDDCNHAGIWQRNLRLLKFHCKSEKSDKEIREIFAGRFHEFGDKWLIAKFLKFQYPNGLGNKKPAIISVMKHLTLHNLLPMVKESLGNDYLYIKDKDKDKSKDKVKNKDKKVKELREGKIDESLELKGMANTEIDELIKFMLAEIKTSRLEGGNKLNRYPCEDVLEICSENFPDQNRVEVVKRIITATAIVTVINILFDYLHFISPLIDIALHNILDYRD